MTEHAGPGDLAGMQSLASRVFARNGYRSPGELAWNYALTYDAPADNPTALWRAGGEVVAWGWLERPDDLMLQINPRQPLLADEVLCWAEQAADGRELRVGIADTEIEVADCLARHGYVPLENPCFSCLSLRLASSVSADNGQAPALPAGYRIAEVLTPADAARWVAVHCQAFPGSRFAPARREFLASVPAYQREFDLAVEAPDGTFAAYCLGWYDEANRTGEFEPVGTHPAHRRRGLAAAVCLAVLRRLAAVGAERAVVNARGDADYPEPKLLYESLGFREHTSARFYRRPTA